MNFLAVIRVDSYNFPLLLLLHLQPPTIIPTRWHRPRGLAAHLIIIRSLATMRLWRIITQYHITCFLDDFFLLDYSVGGEVVWSEREPPGVRCFCSLIFRTLKVWCYHLVLISLDFLDIQLFYKNLILFILWSLIA